MDSTLTLTVITVLADELPPENRLAAAERLRVLGSQLSAPASRFLSQTADALEAYAHDDAKEAS